MNTQQTQWMLHLGQITVPRHWYENAEKTEYYKPEKIRPSPGGESFDWNPIQRGIARLEKVINIILTSNNGNMTAERAYQIILGRKTNLLPINIYNKYMSESRFNHHYHRIRKDIGLFDGRAFKVNFIKDNMEKLSIDKIAIYLETTDNYVKQTISKIKRGIIK